MQKCSVMQTVAIVPYTHQMGMYQPYYNFFFLLDVSKGCQVQLYYIRYKQDLR